MSCGHRLCDGGPATDMEIPKNQRHRDTDGEDKELNNVSKNYRTHSANSGVDDHDTAAYKDTVELRNV